MRTIKTIPGIPKEVNDNFPNGNILNETDTADGTPVVREIYGDILTGLYSALDKTGVVANGGEDTHSTSQLLEALQKLPNLYSDIEQVLTYIPEGAWTVPFNINYLPNKFIFFARAAQDYVPGSFLGQNGVSGFEWDFTSSGFSSGDVLLIVVDQSLVRAYSLTNITGAQPQMSEIFPLYGLPLAYNSQNKIFYREEGILISDTPTADNVELTIRDYTGDNVIVTDMFVMQSYLLNVVLDLDTQDIQFYHMNMNNLSEVKRVYLDGFSLDISNNPYFYADENHIYITNNAGQNGDDYDVLKAEYNQSEDMLYYSENIILNTDFVKTSNGAVKNNILYTFTGGALITWSLTTGTKNILMQYNGVNGILFTYKDTIYFSSNGVAKKIA